MEVERGGMLNEEWKIYVVNDIGIKNLREKMNPLFILPRAFNPPRLSLT